MQIVTLQPLQHKGCECIGIHYQQNALLNHYVQKNARAKWSKTHRCWYVPCTENNYEQIINVLKGKATVDSSELKKYLLKRKSNAFTGAAKEVAKAAMPAPLQLQQSSKHTLIQLSLENSDALQKFLQQLILKSYSPSTIRTYQNEFRQFLQIIKDNPAKDFSVQRLKDYLQYCFEKLKLSENTLHSRMNALKFYYEQVLKKKKFFWEIPRPKKPLQLPHFFNQDEIAAIINATENLKHKVMLMLAYSGGLRVSEVVSLKTRNIDSSRMCIYIENAKGKKDRMVTLSPVLLIMLREYYKALHPTTNSYLFEGQPKGEPYSTRSLQAVLTAAKEKAGVIKPGSVHALRHSFATHLLDNGTDITMIMKLLGHNDLKTTLRYLHVTNRDMLKIVSPLDNLKL